MHPSELFKTTAKAVSKNHAGALHHQIPLNKHTHADELVTIIEDQGLLPTAPRVSVVITAYNHEGFIVQAIESALEQKTDFDYEIIVAEDKSTDSTSDIVLDFQRRYPEKVRLRLAQKNLYSQGIKPWAVTFPACRGKYIAMLEGDDYWTDSLKLQKQVDYLEAHLEAAGCFTDCRLEQNTGQVVKTVDAWLRDYETSYDQYSCLTKLGSCYGTATLLFRRLVFNEGLPDYFLKAGCDFLLDLIITEHGTLDYLSCKTAAYRVHDSGAWQGKKESANILTQLSRLAALGESPDMVDRYSGELKQLLEQNLREYQHKLTIELEDQLAVADHVIDSCKHRHPVLFQSIIKEFCLLQMRSGWRALGVTGKSFFQRTLWLASKVCFSPRLIPIAVRLLLGQGKASMRAKFSKA